MSEYLLGIDNGGTVTKVVLFDLEGRAIRSASRKAAAQLPNPGWAERDMHALWNSNADAIREVITDSGIRPQQILGVGLTAHGNGLYLLDKQGKPMRPGILSIDNRAAAISDEWIENGTYRAVRPATLQQVWPGQPCALLRWLKLYEPEIYKQIGAVLACKDYIRYCLTGEIATDYSDVSGTSLLNNTRRRYSRELLERFAIPEVFDALPAIAEGFSIVGKVTKEAASATGLAVGMPVAGGLLDVTACALGAGVIHPHQLCLIAGTWSINQIVTSEPMSDPDIYMNSIYTPDLWLVLEASATSASNLEWFITQFCSEEQAEAKQRGISVYDVCNEKVATVSSSSTPILFHPFLFGTNVQATARAGFFGVTGWHTRAHFLRAIYEGVVFSHLSHVEKLKSAGAQMDSARLMGGGARSQLWSQMFADVLQLPIEIPEGGEIGARGAAMCAGIGVGAYPDYTEAVRQAVHVERRHQPNPAALPAYHARYAEYQHLLNVLQDSWNRLSKMTT